MIFVQRLCTLKIDFGQPESSLRFGYIADASLKTRLGGRQIRLRGANGTLLGLRQIRSLSKLASEILVLQFGKNLAFLHHVTLIDKGLEDYSIDLGARSDRHFGAYEARANRLVSDRHRGKLDHRNFRREKN